MNRNKTIRGIKIDTKFSEKEQYIIYKKIEELTELKQQTNKQICGYKDKIDFLREMMNAYVYLCFLESVFNAEPQHIRSFIDMELLIERNCL